MSELRITTNNHIREIIYWWQLTSQEQEEFDWIGEGKEDGYSFFRYKGNVYCLSEFMRVDWRVQHARENHPFSEWHGYMSDSFFSGILVKYPEDDYHSYDDGIIVGWYCC